METLPKPMDLADVNPDKGATYIHIKTLGRYVCEGLVIDKSDNDQTKVLYRPVNLGGLYIRTREDFFKSFRKA